MNLNKAVGLANKIAPPPLHQNFQTTALYD